MRLLLGRWARIACWVWGRWSTGWAGTPRRSCSTTAPYSGTSSPGSLSGTLFALVAGGYIRCLRWKQTHSGQENWWPQLWCTPRISHSASETTPGTYSRNTAPATQTEGWWVGPARRWRRSGFSVGRVYTCFLLFPDWNLSSRRSHTCISSDIVFQNTRKHLREEPLRYWSLSRRQRP